jgi:hypothetical protein
MLLPHSFFLIIHISSGSTSIIVPFEIERSHGASKEEAFLRE